jgi:hypothetical protein
MYFYIKQVTPDGTIFYFNVHLFLNFFMLANVSYLQCNYKSRSLNGIGRPITKLAFIVVTPCVHFSLFTAGNAVQ